MVVFNIFSDAIKQYCKEHDLDYEKVVASPKCGNEKALYVQHIKNKGAGLEDEEPAEILISANKDENGEIHIAQYENTNKFLKRN